MRRLRGAAAASAALLASAAQAQALGCRIAGPVPTPHLDRATPEQPRRLLPIGGYTLALSWSPEHCRGARNDARDRFQCGAGNRFGFTLHGLWPDGTGKDWPQYCRPAALLPAATIRRALCATPSAQLLQHEWAKHGTCMADADPERYFARSTALYRSLRFPDLVALSRRPGLNAGTIAAALAGANPGVRADGIRITTTRRGWLDEAWLCLDVRFRSRRCAVQQGGVTPATPVKIWRGGRPDRSERRPSGG